MAPAHITERDGTKPNPPLLGSLAYLLLNLPVGIAGFVFIVTLVSVGVSTAIIWVGLPVLALALLGWRVGARLERQRVHAMLRTYVATPYRPLPSGMSAQWKARVKEAATWKDMTYFLLMFPIGIAEFTLMTTFWAASLWLVFLPVYFGFMPDDWYPEVWNHPFGQVDSTWEALPWAAIGALLLAITVAMTKALGSLHARFARVMLGPSQRMLDALEGLTTRPPVNWNAPATFRDHAYPGA